MQPENPLSIYADVSGALRLVDRGIERWAKEAQEHPDPEGRSLASESLRDLRKLRLELQRVVDSVSPDDGLRSSIKAFVEYLQATFPLETQQAYYRCFIASLLVIVEPELHAEILAESESLTGGEPVRESDWELARQVYENAPEHVRAALSEENMWPYD